jgi:HSP20 family protein
MPFVGEGPRIDVAETETELVVAADLPGLEEKDVEVSLGGDLLTIRGERKTESEKRLLRYRINERTSGSFSRTIALPSGVDAEAISASFKNGVLTITIPKTQEAAREATRVAVKGE